VVLLHDDSYYKNLGFKCGLEIHQRLATKHKLFCSCSADTPNDQQIGQITRKQRAVAGELGLVDRSTSFESSRKRSFVYNVFKSTSCLVDIDEEPPHKVNPEAMESALRFASAFNLKVPDEIEPMRKQVVDGSDPSSFQRSMMVAFDGYVEVNGRKVPIPSMFLEEESSGIEGTKDETVFYNVDRIGIPLVEIDTDPSISNPKEAKQVALKIGAILRLTGKKHGGLVTSDVQRGIGTIRQDVNVSIAQGTRVEMKGLQDIEYMDILIENEVERQVKLVEIKKMLLGKGASVPGDAKDLSKTMAHATGKIITESLSHDGIVLGALLRGFGGMLGMEINPDRRLGSEISDYAKMAGVKGIIHSDEDLGKYGISSELITSIKKELGAKDGDAFILVTAQRSMCELATGFALDRARMALSTVPPETRAVADAKKGTTRFMRPLPGGSRMYPETDAEPIEVSARHYDKIKADTVYMDERIAKIRKELNNQQLAEQLAYSTRLQLYEYIISKVKDVNLVVAATLLEKVRELERSGITFDMDRDVMAEIFAKYSRGEITKAAIGEIIKYSPRSTADIDRVIKSKSLSRISGAKLGDIIKSLGSKEKGDALREVMSKYRFNVDGEELNNMLGGKT